MTKQRVVNFRVAPLVLAIGLCANSSVYAAPALEEVLVTATLRTESLQDVPVSVNAMAGEKMQEAGIDKIEDLQAYVPNLSMSETGIGTNIYIRGIGSGVNPGFEQSVGMYFDGVSYSRAQLTRAPFLDLARVEVLRGPQNILYGKNSIAGALSLVSARPGQEQEGMITGLYEPDHGEKIVDFVVSGPITDTLGGRIAIRKREFDGYIENLTLNRDEPQRDESTIRAILDWDATPDLTAMLKLELGKFDVLGRQVEIVNDQPSAALGGATYSQALAGSFGADPSVLNTTQDYKRSSNGDYSNNRTKNITLNVDYALGESTLTFITGLLQYEFDELCDCDFTGAPVFSVPFEEDYDQYSQEVRWVSAAGGTFEHIGGVYYQKSNLDFYDSIVIDSGILPAAVFSRVRGQAIAAGASPADADASAGAASAAIANTTTPRYFTSDAELWSVFWQTTWNATDRLRATLGLRYSDETKDGSRSLTVADLAGTERPIGTVDGVLASLFKIERHDLKGSQSGGKLAPSLNVQFDVNDDVMAYATASRGHKSGGFDARSNASPSAAPNPVGASISGSFEYDEEQATSFEIGAKTSFMDGRGELNIAAFFTKYDDLQVSIFDGTLGFNVGNAGAAETKGIELDGRFALTDNLLLTGALAFLDFEFTDFENGQCYQGQTPDSTVSGVNYCDYKGKTNQYVADYSGNVGLVYTKAFGDAMEFRAGTDFTFTDDYNSSQNLDPSQEQDGYVEVNMRLAIADVKSGWEVALIGKNLTDEDVVSYSNDVPLANSSFGSIGHYAFIERPRSVAVQVAYRW
ncbi:TonB-dependent receptor [Zhongshania aliphaticivorans]|uniref:TonB-dependent receptor n=1 Tax=Zhongshania aliphaticivorans TaxID=1470434 RepID=UPI0012E40361|nr:TonB-dependent receptor [Zhongshania aliphaticivorans]CAA0079791.1 Colicin I receptor [Zhongshania aliphaticivorans]